MLCECWWHILIDSFLFIFSCYVCYIKAAAKVFGSYLEGVRLKKFPGTQADAIVAAIAKELLQALSNENRVYKLVSICLYLLNNSGFACSLT